MDDEQAQTKTKTLLGRFLRGAAIVYIALIGIFAIEELTRREKFLALLTARETEIAAALAASQANDADAARAALLKERNQILGLKRELSALILVDAIHPANAPPRTLKVLTCEYASLGAPNLQCGAPKAIDAREIAAIAVLKRTTEQRSTGDVFAVIVVIAAIGGALIRMYLPSESEKDAFRTLLRAMGGGVVCYLALTGGSILFNGVNLGPYTSPSTGALIGLLCGMFSTKLFELVSRLVDGWVEKLAPQPKAPAPDVSPDGAEGPIV